ncbi:myosin heavy chain [Trichosporon asahii var. asahii CBS 8904]|uniref:Autophagy-related protein 11 n=1 Tax=Trichosporon asahii var. asahii (strain CBS 8904) TaxID=1220162 RepID=K1VP83_TRIAC|nr:myosin heavy chain [Trichosporon asahii var. asahii CBS 8904]
MDIYLASDGGIVKVEHALSDYDSSTPVTRFKQKHPALTTSLEGVYADVSAATGVVSGNILLFTEDGRELKQEVLEELWERGGGASSSHTEIVYLFNRETFFSEPERWAAELREEVVLPPPLLLSGDIELAQAQSPFASAYDHLCHLQSLFKAQAHALRIAYANLSFHLGPIVEAFREFTGRVDDELDAHDQLLKGYDVDMAMLPKVTVHESLYRRRDKDTDDKSRKSLLDWIHTKKMEQVRDLCQYAHMTRYNNVASEMDELALQSDADLQQAEHRIHGVETEFAEALGRIELAMQQVEALMQADSQLDQAMREDLASMTSIKVSLRAVGIADYQVRITKFSRPMTDLDNDLRQKSAFPHLERLHNLPFAYAANVVEIVRRKEFSHSLVEWASRIGHAVNTYLDEEAKRRQRHKTENQLPWEIPALEESQLPRINMSINGAEALTSVGLGKGDIEQLVASIKELQDDPEFMSLDPTENPIPVLSNRLAELLPSLDHLNEDLNQALDLAVINAAQRETPGETEKLRAQNADYEARIAELEREHLERMQELEESKEQEIKTLNARQAELKDEVARLRNDLSDEAVQKQKLMDQLEEKTRDHEDRMRELEEHSELVSALQADMVQEKDRATDLGVRLQEALLDVDGLRSAETTLIVQMKDMQDERTRILTDLGEAQLLAQNYESELAGAKVELEATAAQLVQAQKDRDKAIKEKSAEAERLMRDQIAEADGDRAVLEHQNLTLTKELEEVRKEMDEKLNSVKNASIRREDGLKAELKLAKAQLRDVQRREALLASELAVAKDSSTQLTQKDAHQAELLKESVQLCGKYHEACYRLMGAISASTTISGSLSLPQRANSPPPPSILSIGSNELKDSAFLVRSLEKASAFELESFADAVLKTINLARRLSKSCKQYRDLSRNKITISSFGKGDLVLFLPTRNAAVNAWAAFNVSAPHHFLHVTDQIRQQLQGKDYYLARITGTDEAIVNGDSPSTNPFGLAEGLRYYSHHVEEWIPTAIRTRRSTSGPAGQTAQASHPPHPERALTAPTAVRAKQPANIISRDRERTSPTSISPKAAAPSPKESSPEATSPHSASPVAASPKQASKSPPPPKDSPKGTPKESPKGSKAGSRRASPERSERREKRSSRPSSRTPTPTTSVNQPPAPVPAASESDPRRASLRPRSR